MDFSNLPKTFQKTIPEEYKDFLGHMNVMWYTYLFDKATFSFFGTMGFGETYHLKSGNGSFAVEGHTRYLAEVRIGESVTIYSRALGRGTKTIHFMHFMVRDHDQVLAATVEFVGIHIDMSIRRSSAFPKDIATAVDKTLEEHQGLDWEAPICGTMSP